MRRIAARKIGVEEELLLVHPDDGRPLALSGRALADGHSDHLQAELQQEMIEIGSEPVEDLGALRTSLLRHRRMADDRARAVGARTAAIASSPLPIEPHRTRDERYDWMAEHFGVTARTMVCGCHVHVDVESREEGVAVLDRIRVWLPVLTALSADSPFHEGADTGYASYRSQIWSRWPSAGPLPVFGSVEALDAFERDLLSTGVLLDRGMLYFDARLSSRYPTIEVRVADVCMDLEDTVTIAALTRALVHTAAAEWRSGGIPSPLPAAALRLASWRASAEGIGGSLVHPESGEPSSARLVIDALVDHVGGALDESGDRKSVISGVSEILRRGTGADRQRSVLSREGSLSAVMLDAVEVTARGTR